MRSNRRPRLVYVLTHPASPRYLLRGQLAFMREHGFDVTVITSPGPDLEVVREREGVRVIGVPMRRGLHLQEGPLALAALTRALREIRPDIVNACTPKGGLLGMLASRALRVPARIYTVLGLRLESERGVFRSALGAAEKAASACAHRVVCMSESLAQTYAAGGYASRDRISVIALNGIDLAHFRPRDETRDLAATVRQRMGIPRDAMVVGYVGRYAKDKGIGDVLPALERARTHRPDVWGLVVGGEIPGDGPPRGVLEELRRAPQTVFAEFVQDVMPYYAAMDVVLFPSCREGLPNVPLEAAACELPVVGYFATGVVDAVQHGRTGALVPIGDVHALGEALLLHVRDPAMREAHGRAGRQRMSERFSQAETWHRWLRLYQDLTREGADHGATVMP